MAWDGEDVVIALALRFLGAGVGFAIFSYLAMLFGAWALSFSMAFVLATRVERRSDMVNGRAGRYLGVKCA